VRVLVVDTYYPAFIAEHYAARPGLATEPYTVQLASLMSRRFGTSDAYSSGLAAAGHEAEDVIVNCAPLQLAWAREHGPRWLRAAARAPHPRARLAVLHAIAHAQIAAFAPDVVYLQDLWFFTRPELDRLRRNGRLVAGQIASEPPPPERLGGFDLIVTSFPHYVERFREIGVDSLYLPIAFHAPILEEVPGDPEQDRPHGAVFVGGVNPRVHPAGAALVERLSAAQLIGVWGYGADELAPGSPILDRHHGEAWGLDMYRVLARSRLVVNRHIEAAEGFANNMRLFETTGMGALLLTERAPNLPGLFAPGEEVETYASEEELVEKLRHFAAHPAEAARIAAAGQRRTLAEHTYARRIPELAVTLQRRLG
jgi:spore maturation protein CgeB